MLCTLDFTSSEHWAPFKKFFLEHSLQLDVQTVRVDPTRVVQTNSHHCIVSEALVHDLYTCI